VRGIWGIPARIPFQTGLDRRLRGLGASRAGVRLKPPRRVSAGLRHLTCALVPAHCLKLIDNAQRPLMRDILDIGDAVLVRSTVPPVTFVRAMPESVLQQIEADIAEAERLMTELRLRIAMSRSAGEETTKSERRLQDILKGWMLLQDQRQKAAEAAQPAEKANQTTSGPATDSGLTASKDGQADPAVQP
jgi:hypothetical protein